MHANGPAEGTTAFLLAQIGADAARQFAERIAALELTPPQAGLLRLVAASPGRPQQVIAAQLGTPPSRLVALVDRLEQRGLLERRRSTGDRRLSSLYLTDAGEKLLARLGRAAEDHDDAVCGVLAESERGQLRELLLKLAGAHGLVPGVHPGYRIGAERPGTC